MYILQTQLTKFWNDPDLPDQIIYDRIMFHFIISIFSHTWLKPLTMV